MSTNDQERANRLSQLTLSSPLLDILGLLLRAIDKRSHVLANAAEGDFHAETCDACSGVGYLLISHSDEESEDADDQSAQGPSNSGPVPNVGQVIAGLAGLQFGSVPPAQASTSAPSPAAAAALPVAQPQQVAQPQPAAPVASPAQPVAQPQPVAQVTQPQQVAQAQPALSTPLVQSLLASLTAPAPPAAGTATLPTVGPIPPPSVVIPGFNPLGPHTPVPLPVNAVYATDGADRYYSVTKGIRVGVFSGWQNTSRYVTSVPGATFSRHPSLHAAFQAYVDAFGRNFVTYV